MAGDPKLEASQELPDFPYARYAELLGLRGHPRRRPRADRRGLGRGARRRPARRARGDHRPRRAAAAAAHHARAGAGPHVRAGPGRPERCAASCVQSLKRQARRVPARTMTGDRATQPDRRRRSSGLRSGAYTIPTDAPEADGTLRLGRDDARRRARRAPAAARGSATPTPTRATATLDPASTLAGAVARRATPSRRRRAWRRWRRAVRNLGRARRRVRWRSRAVDAALWDLKAQLLGLPLAELLGRRARRGADLRQRRLHLLRRSRSSAAQLAGWVERGHPAREDEGRHASRSDDLAPRARRRARRSAPTPSCSSTPTAPTRASRRWRWPRRFAELRRELVRGAGLLRRPRGPAAAARPRRRPGMDVAAGEYGYDLAVLPAHARGRRRRRAAGRRHALRRHHRLPRASPRSARRTSSPLSAHCAPVAARARSAARSRRAAPPGVLPRPRPHRAACSSTARWSRARRRPAARPRPSRARHRAQDAPTPSASPPEEAPA